MNIICIYLLIVAFITIVSSQSKSSSQDLLYVEEIRAKVISLEDFLWNEIQESENDQDVSLRKIIEFHENFITSTSFLMQNYTKENFALLSEISTWNDIECDLMLISKKFNEFVELMIKFRKMNINVVKEMKNYIYMDKFLRRIMKFFEFETENNFYAVIVHVSN